MAKLHLLGTGAALSSADRTTTMLAVSADQSMLLVDCGGDVVQRALAAGLDLEHLDALFLTHEHPDHVSGFPLFVEKIWLSSRRRPIPVRGPGPTLEQARKLFDAFETGTWKKVPKIEWGIVPLEENTLAWHENHWRVTASPGFHSVPSVALRIEDERGGGVVTYSSDTARSDAVARLAEGADILVHEATGDYSGHTSVQDAAHVAAQAGVGRLVLVHLPPAISEDALGDAKKSFPHIELGHDGAEFDF